ncbi:SDR family NAD(P)-dependent oxidoreductase [Streptomyces sp. NPDC005811]|uniref:SDR family oxidoreductase n=1 Tax=Streptomyces sp. NPDC005811 TaxID=3154565 RepID=UPI0033FC229C
MRIKNGQVAVITGGASRTGYGLAEALADRTIAAYGRADLVCNNAGVVSTPAPVREQEARTWELMIGVKVLGVVHGVKAFAPLLIEQGTGHFLNTASSGGPAPLPDLTPYTTTMHAVVGLTETLDIDLRGGAPASVQNVAVRCGAKLTPREVAEPAIGAIEADRSMSPSAATSPSERRPASRPCSPSSPSADAACIATNCPQAQCPG